MSSDTLSWYLLRKPHIHTTTCFQGFLFGPPVRFARDKFYRVMSENKADIQGNRIVECKTRDRDPAVLVTNINKSKHPDTMTVHGRIKVHLHASLTSALKRSETGHFHALAVLSQNPLDRRLDGYPRSSGRLVRDTCLLAPVWNLEFGYSGVNVVA